MDKGSPGPHRDGSKAVMNRAMPLLWMKTGVEGAAKVVLLRAIGGLTLYCLPA